MGRVINMPVKNYPGASAVIAANQRRIESLARDRAALIAKALCETERLFDHIQSLHRHLDTVDKLANSLGDRCLAAPLHADTEVLRSGLRDATEILTRAIAELWNNQPEGRDNI